MSTKPNPELLKALIELFARFSAESSPQNEDESDIEFIRRRMSELLGQKAVRKLKPEQLLLMEAGTRLLDEIFKSIARPDEKEMKEFKGERDKLAKIEKIEKLAKIHPNLFKTAIEGRIYAMDTTLRRYLAFGLPSADVMKKSIKQALSATDDKRDPFAGQTPRYARVGQWQVFSGKELPGGNYVLTIVKGAKPDEIVTASFEVVQTERFEYAHILVFPLNGQVEIRGKKESLDSAKQHFISSILIQIKDAPKSLVVQEFVGKEEVLAKQLAAKHISSFLKNLDEGKDGGGETIEVKAGNSRSGNSLDQGIVWGKVANALGMKKEEVKGIDVKRLNSCYIFENDGSLVVYEVWPDDGRVRFSLQATREADISRVTGALNTILGDIRFASREEHKTANDSKRIPRRA
jgi:hypothetical protein